MKFILRMATRENYEALRRRIQESRHDVVFEPSPLLGQTQADAEFLSLGLAERFGVSPPVRHEVAFIIPNKLPGSRIAPLIISGITFSSQPTPERELRVIFSSILTCVRKHNEQSNDTVNTVGLTDDYLKIDELGADGVARILWQELR